MSAVGFLLMHKNANYCNRETEKQVVERMCTRTVGDDNIFALERKAADITCDCCSLQGVQPYCEKGEQFFERLGRLVSCFGPVNHDGFSYKS